MLRIAFRGSSTSREARFAQCGSFRTLGSMLDLVVNEDATEIVEVHAAALDSERLRGFSIDRPMHLSTVDRRYFPIAGWVLPLDAPAVAVEVIVGGELVARAPVDPDRSDLRAVLADASAPVARPPHLSADPP